MGTTRDDLSLEGMDLTQLVDQAMADEEAYEGASDQEPYERDSPEVTPPAIGVDPGGNLQDERVLLVNIDFQNETFYIPDSAGQFTGDSVKFMDGYLNATRAVADWILQIAPYVYEEPKEGGEPFVFDKTGFRTRNSAGYQKYVAVYYANQ